MKKKKWPTGGFSGLRTISSPSFLHFNGGMRRGCMRDGGMNIGEFHPVVVFCVRGGRKRRNHGYFVASENAASMRAFSL